MSTFTLPRYYEGVPGQDVMYHGVGKLRISYIIDSTFKVEILTLLNETSIIEAKIFIFVIQGLLRKEMKPFIMRTTNGFL